MHTEESARLPRFSQLVLLSLVVGLSSLLPAPTLSAAEPLPAVTDMTPARALWDAAQQADANCSPDSVDLYYRAAVEAYASVAAGVDCDAALALYNSALGRCLRAATKHQRIDPRTHLLIQTPAGLATVPITHTGFVWKPTEFSYLIDPCEIKRTGDFRRTHKRCGVGATEVVVRNPQCDAMDHFMLPKWHSFSATALLRPDLDAWRQGKLPKDALEFVDPLRVEQVQLAGSPRCLAADFESPMSQMFKLGEEMGYRKGNFLSPGNFANVAGVYLLEPYQPNKIPLVLVHGTQTGMLDWSDLFCDLRANPSFNAQYQVWLFTYPTGAPYLRTAHILRTSLQEARATFDPACADCALDQMVLAGHSQGGMLVKPMVTWSDDKVAHAVFRVPFNQLTLTAEERELLTNYLFFEPQPYVKRVIYVCTPFTGVTIPVGLGARVGQRIIRPPQESEEKWDHIKDENPLAIRLTFRKLPTSAELFRRHQPLHETLRELRVSPCVVSHVLVGKGDKLPAISPSDRIVPVRSAQTKEAASTLFVNQKHGEVHHVPEATKEFQRILCEHLASLGRN